MNKQPFDLSPDDIKKQLTQIRQQLRQKASESDSVKDVESNKDEMMVPFVVSDALKGIDISQAYPAFYQKLLRHTELRNSFIEALEAVEGEPKSLFKPFVTPSIPQLSIEHFAPGKWRIRWQRTPQQLLELFVPPLPKVVYRQDDVSVSDEIITLLHTQTNVEGERTTLTLTATRLLDQPDELQLQLFIESMHFLAFQAHLRWGIHQANISLPANTFTQFPPVTLSAVMDETGQTITSGLDLTLEPLDSLLVNS